MTPKERYHTDPLFHRLTDLLYHELRQGYLTPTEIREAALLAQIRFEEEHPRYIPSTNARKEEIMRWLNDKPREDDKFRP